MDEDTIRKRIRMFIIHERKRLQTHGTYTPSSNFKIDRLLVFLQFAGQKRTVKIYGEGIDPFHSWEIPDWCFEPEALDAAVDFIFESIDGMFRRFMLDDIQMRKLGAKVRDFYQTYVFRIDDSHSLLVERTSKWIVFSIGFWFETRPESIAEASNCPMKDAFLDFFEAKRKEIEEKLSSFGKTWLDMYSAFPESLREAISLHRNKRTFFPDWTV